MSTTAVESCESNQLRPRTAASPFPIILSSPSGGGKTTITKRLLAMRSDIGYSVSATTRMQRRDEVDGRDYHFLTYGEFVAKRDRGEFAEFAEVHGKLYGTLRREVERVLARGQHVIMDIDVQGAEQFAERSPSRCWSSCCRRLPRCCSRVSRGVEPKIPRTYSSAWRRPSGSWNRSVCISTSSSTRIWTGRCAR